MVKTVNLVKVCRFANNVLDKAFTLLEVHAFLSVGMESSFKVNFVMMEIVIILMDVLPIAKFNLYSLVKVPSQADAQK